MSMVSTSVKIDAKTKKEAQQLFKELGMNLSTAINIFLKQAVREQRIPFSIENKTPSKELIEALREMEEIKKDPENYKTYGSPKEMFEDILGEYYGE